MGKLNILPSNPTQEKDSEELHGRFPAWLHRTLPKGTTLMHTGKLLEKYKLNTVCEEAKCPNRLECYAKQTATFLALGKECSRNCGFCSIDFSKTPKAPEEDEPERIALSVRELNLKHVVITMVARDDLPDQGSTHLAKIIQKVRALNSGCTIEVLTSDFAGDLKALDTVLDEAPEIFNHNIETVRRLSPRVRHKATYDRTLALLSHAKQRGASCWIKSGIMVGLGEEESEVFATLTDLKEHGCDIVTMGQYLQPTKQKLRVKAFITPAQFEVYAKYGRALGIKHMYCGPFVRSSYNAQELWKSLQSSS